MNKLLYMLMLFLLSSCSTNLLKTNVRNYTIEKTTFQTKINTAANVRVFAKAGLDKL